ncbi:Transcriptional regulatory protein RcsB [Serratia plymuthica]|uniref:helix-turn-helix transcriptional regulator n=1 Tax=Serratia plymuthica TaxID=82996 RepID=UPI00159A95A2|nr:LuxR family transcriptional regulator [Serratia plymuthica]QJW57409.1 Transcriptional regulatory protein RcsB [Serratia plymuthica]
MGVNMLNILLMDSNFYQVSGLSFLILKQLKDEGLNEACFLLPSLESNRDIANIIFRDDMVTINVFDKKYIPGKNETEQKDVDKITIHVPFWAKSQTLNDISRKISKILMIARADYNMIINKEESYWSFGLKKYAQLSDTENDVMILIGRGYNSTEISVILNRSKKTIGTHYRNASRKMGVANQAEFYRYASFIAKCQRDERNTFCL